ncbi:MAG: nuclear transport factor 2 family protein [Pseudonocardiaceae bacterium]
MTTRQIVHVDGHLTGQPHRPYKQLGHQLGGSIGDDRGERPHPSRHCRRVEAFLFGDVVGQSPLACLRIGPSTERNIMRTYSAIIQASYAAFARGDIDAALELFSPDIEWTHPDGMNDYGLGGTEKGLDQVRDFMKRARGVFSEFRSTHEEFVESGDRVMVIGVHHMRVAHSGQVCKVRFVHSWRLADGKATHFEDYHDTAAVRALLREPTRQG